MDWYPQDKKELNNILEKFIKQKSSKEIISHEHKFSGKMKRKKPEVSAHGIIVPHAGYAYSGKIAGKVYSRLNAKKVLILTPNHYLSFDGVLTHNKNYWETPLGKIKIIESDFKKTNLKQEHAIDNQIPFLQKVGVEEILPLSVGEISLEEAREIAEKIGNFDGKIVVSTDLSHFHEEKIANKMDKETIKIIENLEVKNFRKIDACGKYPLMILIELCKLKKWKPKLVEYKTSGDVTKDFSSVVGYAGFVF